MKLNHAQRVKIFTSQDGRRRLCLFRRSDGLYEFESEERVVGDEFEGEWWAPRIRSGLYESLDEAERDAASRAVWIADAVVGLGGGF